jgi:putative glycosyltransferase (TIGR04372 family)
VVRLGRDSRTFDRADIFPLVDYPHSGFYSPKNDVILMGIMKYLICSDSGMAALAHWWRKPIFLVDFPDILNLPAIGKTYKSAPIILPKVVRYRKDDALLSLEEIMNSGVFKVRTPVRRDYLLSPNSEIYLTPNSPEVIRNTILLGNLELLQSAPPHLVEFGKKAYQRLYGFESYSLAPVLSPYWPNLLSEGVLGNMNKL